MMQRNNLRKIHRNKELNKRSIFTRRTLKVLRCPPTRSYRTHLIWLWEPNRWVGTYRHTCRPLNLELTTQEEFKPFCYDIQVFLSLHRHQIFLLYLLTFSQWHNCWHQQLSYKLLNEIYILKNNLSTTATSGHQTYYKGNDNIKLVVSHLASGTASNFKKGTVVGLYIVNTGRELL